MMSFFRGCDLRETNCSKTKITTSDFRDANLAGADLTAADWTGLVRGQVVEHHPGPYDGLRLAADDRQHYKLRSKCVARFERGLRIPVSR
jgi:uncharacterized protein YjbI with pentapeptide repeats